MHSLLKVKYRYTDSKTYNILNKSIQTYSASYYVKYQTLPICTGQTHDVDNNFSYQTSDSDLFVSLMRN